MKLEEEENKELLDTFKKRKVSIIFGGSGFIGLHLTKKLLNQEHKVIVIDKYKHSELEVIKDKLINKNDLHFFRFDMVQDAYNNLDFLNTIYEEDDGNNINIFHLASNLGPEKVTENHSIDDYILNFNFYNYLKKLVDFNKKLKFNKIIFASTSEVYGEQENMSECESTSINILKDKYRPQYALQKLTAENLLLNFGKDFNQEVIVTRLFNIVGPGQKEGFVISNFNKIFKENLETIKSNIRALKNIPREDYPVLSLKPFIIYGDGKQSRTFTDISDTVNALELLSNYKENYKEDAFTINEETKIINSIINIACSKNEISILKLAYKYLEFYKHILQNFLIDKDEFNKLNENQKKYINYLLEEIHDKKTFISFISPNDENNISIGASKRIPSVFKLYKVLGYKPVKNINNIIGTLINE